MKHTPTTAYQRTAQSGTWNLQYQGNNWEKKSITCINCISGSKDESRFGKKQHKRNYLVLPIQLALQYHTPPPHFPLLSFSEPPVSCESW